MFMLKLENKNYVYNCVRILRTQNFTVSLQFYSKGQFYYFYLPGKGSYSIPIILFYEVITFLYIVVFLSQA